jgi:hypothetical protein
MFDLYHRHYPDCHYKSCASLMKSGKFFLYNIYGMISSLFIFLLLKLYDVASCISGRISEDRIIPYTITGQIWIKL